MNIVLINAPYLDIYGSLNVGKNFNFPLGIGYIAGMLKKNGHTVAILEPEIYEMTAEDVVDYIKERSADIVGITCATANFKGAEKLARHIKEKLGTFTVIGGVHASSVPEQILLNYPQFDAAVIGEGEYTMLEMCEALEKDRDNLSQVNGIMFRQKGEIIKTPPRPFIENLDELPFPARELVDLNNYRPQVHLDRGKKSATMITSRGCPAHCTFCASFKTLGFKFRAHSPEYVVSEIEHLVKNYNIEHVIFVDDTFTIQPERVKKICNLMIEKNLKIDWYCFARVVPISKEILQLMKKAGCFSLLFGVESADPQVLKNVKKGITPEQATKAFELSNELGFKTIATFILGLPGDTKETIEKTINFAVKLKPTIASFNRLVPFPGTEIYETYYQSKFEDGKHWDDFVPKAANPVIELEGVSTQALQKLTNVAYMRFYLRPSQIVKILLSIKTFGEFRAYMRGAYGLFRRMAQWRKAAVRY